MKRFLSRRIFAVINVLHRTIELTVNSKVTILFADDSDDEVLLLESAFEQAGWNAPFFRVKNGQEAIAYIQGDGEFAERKKYPYPRFLLLDLWMPEMNGLEVLKWIRANPTHKRLPVFVLTSEDRVQIARQIYDAGANCLLPKPRNFEDRIEMAKALRNYLAMIQLPPAPG